MAIYNTKQSFKNFVTGDSNEFAFKCASYVAEDRENICNPLLLWGKSGTGKTHLMMAIEDHIREDDPAIKIKYMTTKQLMADIVNHCRENSLNEMKKTYSSLDVLLIDDIQDLAGKEATQDMVLDLLEDLYAGKKQIVMTADREPDRIQGLNRKIVSRIKRGVVAKINAPDYWVKKRIMRQYMADLELELSDSLEDSILKESHNVFEIEGEVKKQFMRFF